MIDVAIFSYNRLFYLKNALHSVQRNVSDARVRIYDDGSDQSEMKNFLFENSDLVGARLKGLDSSTVVYMQTCNLRLMKRRKTISC